MMAAPLNSPVPLAPEALAAMVQGEAAWPFAMALPEGVTLGHLLMELRRLGWAAADILLAYSRGEQPPYGFPKALSVDAGGEGPVTAADLAVNQWLLEGLQASFPAAGWTLLSEETAKAQLRDGEPLAAEWLWILDPLDGTKDFLQGTGEYAVHLALVREQVPLLGVVLLPEPGELWIGVINGDAPASADASASTGVGAAAVAGMAVVPGMAWRENRAGEVFPVGFSSRRQRQELVLVASRNHRDQRLELLLKAMALGDTLAIGSVGGKVATILRGDTDLYISLSGKSAPKDWDMAAPHAVLQAAGGAFTHADGRPLTYNTGDIRQAGCLIASHGSAHAELCRIAAAAMATIDPGFAL
jgi:3'(2'), 5'-bisphosphate nucleotidase